VVVALREAADPQRREVTSKYFPTALQILGVPVPEIRKTARRLRGELKGDPPHVVLEMALRLKDMPILEVWQVAYELLDMRRDARDLLGIGKVRLLGKGNDNWASVDAFSVLVSGPVWREGGIPDREVVAWTSSKDRWWRRTALVSTVPLNLPSRGGSGDVDRTLGICDRLAGDADPMVAKALSWALRSLISVDRGAVEGFLATHGDMVPAFVRREVRNKIETGRKLRRT
jgi:3-methyladenine DNA glycosylase AlkD